MEVVKVASHVNITPSYYDVTDLIILKSITPIHVGVGGAGGVVDLPIQRDEYGYPCIYSSSIKGALKTALLYTFTKTLNDYKNARNAVQALLGSEPEEGETETFESSIAILDAYLLALPTRSLKSVYAYITSPFLLERFYERLELLTSYLKDRENTQKLQDMLSILKIITEKEPGSSQVFCLGEDEECENLEEPHIQGGKVVLAEEFILDLNGGKKDKEQLKPIMSFLKNTLKLDKPLLIVSDEVAREIIDRSIVRYTRVRLRKDTKTVEEGPWTEEYLPPRSTLYTVMLYKRPPLSKSFINKVLGRNPEENIGEDEYLKALEALNLLKKDYMDEAKSEKRILNKMSAIVGGIREKVKEMIVEQLKGYLILGGHETIGKGIVKLEIFDSQSSLKAFGVDTK
ncbi:MAG: type III-B CRISPR module RAMP protein Cmr4 [Infirmifilum sp.]